MFPLHQSVDMSGTMKFVSLMNIKNVESCLPEPANKQSVFCISETVNKKNMFDASVLAKFKTVFPFAKLVDKISPYGLTELIFSESDIVFCPAFLKPVSVTEPLSPETVKVSQHVSPITDSQHDSLETISGLAELAFPETVALLGVSSKTAKSTTILSSLKDCSAS